jgi:hypothetical protein
MTTVRGVTPGTDWASVGLADAKPAASATTLLVIFMAASRRRILCSALI